MLQDMLVRDVGCRLTRIGRGTKLKRYKLEIRLIFKKFQCNLRSFRNSKSSWTPVLN